MLFKNNRKLRKVGFHNEGAVQEYFESNLKEILDYDFVASEFSVGKYRIDTLAFDQENQSFKIIEYKNVKNQSLVDQGYAYLTILHDRKADFVLKYNEVNNSRLTLNDIDWSQSRIIYVSTHFTSYQLDATSFKNMPFDLYKVSRYEEDLVLIEELTKSINVEVDDFLDNETKQALKEIVVLTEEDHLEGKPKDIVDLYLNLKEEISSFGDLKTEAKKLYIAFKGTRNVIDIEIQRRKLKIHINLKEGELIDPEGLAIDQSKTGHWGNGDYRVEISDFNNKEYLMYLFKQSYEKNK